jgi:divinyl protochlorophyllide a 8-vinyl-reductase
MKQALRVNRSMHGLSDDPSVPGVIGPNAVLQLMEALKVAGLGDLSAPIFATAGVAEWLTEPPTAMVDQRPVARLHQVLRAVSSPQEGAALMADAGRLTADYILANRIPQAAQMVLKLLPARLAAAVFVPAIKAHSWTFAGTGQFTGQAGLPTVFTLTGNPLCAGERAAAPVCAWQAAVFQRLFQVLVSPAAIAVETECEASGGACCRFEVDWRKPRR